jgi:signal transduction histidine kinase
MKRTTMVLAGLAFLFVLSVGISVAQEEKATKEECVAKVKEAAALIKEVGFEAAKVKLGDPNGPFVWKGTYIFVQNFDEVMLVNAQNPKLIGKSMRGIKDMTGKMFNAEMLQVANGSGEGWVVYTWPKPGEKEPSPKVSYIYRVPGEDLFVGAGIYQ